MPSFFASSWRIEPWRCALTAIVFLAAIQPGFARHPHPRYAVPFASGAVYGQVVDSKTGKPIAGATVALKAPSGRIVAWTITNADGLYRLDANPIAALDLIPLSSHRHRANPIMRGFVDVIRFPLIAADAAVNTAVGMVKTLNPIGTVKAAAISAAEGNPLTLAQTAAVDAANLVSAKSRQTVRGNAATAVIDPAKKLAQKGPQPGEAAIMVSAPQYKEYEGNAAAFCMAPPGPGPFGKQTGIRAWLDTVTLDSAADAKGASGTRDEAAKLTAASLSPIFAPAGSPVKISVQIASPPVHDWNATVVARFQRTGQVIALSPQGGGLYSGTLCLPPRTPLGSAAVTVAAINNSPVLSQHSRQIAYCPLALAARSANLAPGRPYRFDPRIFAAENRLDLEMVVLNPLLQSPVLPATAAVPSPPPATALRPQTPANPPAVKSASASPAPAAKG